MKFLAFALLVLAQGSQGNKFSTNDLNKMVESGMIDKEKLLRSGIPVTRKLQNNNYGGNGQYSSYNSGNNNVSELFICVCIIELVLLFSKLKFSFTYNHRTTSMVSTT